MMTIYKYNRRQTSVQTDELLSYILQLALVVLCVKYDTQLDTQNAGF